MLSSSASIIRSDVSPKKKKYSQTWHWRAVSSCFLSFSFFFLFLLSSALSRLCLPRTLCPLKKLLICASNIRCPSQRHAPTPTHLRHLFFFSPIFFYQVWALQGKVQSRYQAKDRPLPLTPLPEVLSLCVCVCVCVCVCASASDSPP
jgi:hypothetical protein